MPITQEFNPTQLKRKGGGLSFAAAMETPTKQTPPASPSVGRTVDKKNETTATPIPPPSSPAATTSATTAAPTPAAVIPRPEKKARKEKSKSSKQDEPAGHYDEKQLFGTLKMFETWRRFIREPHKVREFVRSMDVFTSFIPHDGAPTLSKIEEALRDACNTDDLKTKKPKTDLPTFVKELCHTYTHAPFVALPAAVDEQYEIRFTVPVRILAAEARSSKTIEVPAAVIIDALEARLTKSPKDKIIKFIITGIEVSTQAADGGNWSGRVDRRKGGKATPLFSDACLSVLMNSDLIVGGVKQDRLPEVLKDPKSTFIQLNEPALDPVSLSDYTSTTLGQDYHSKTIYRNTIMAEIESHLGSCMGVVHQKEDEHVITAFRQSIGVDVYAMYKEILLWNTYAPAADGKDVIDIPIGHPKLSDTAYLQRLALCHMIGAISDPSIENFRKVVITVPYDDKDGKKHEAVHVRLSKQRLEEELAKVANITSVFGSILEFDKQTGSGLSIHVERDPPLPSTSVSFDFVFTIVVVNQSVHPRRTLMI